MPKRGMILVLVMCMLLGVFSTGVHVSADASTPGEFLDLSDFTEEGCTFRPAKKYFDTDNEEYKRGNNDAKAYKAYDGVGRDNPEKEMYYRAGFIKRVYKISKKNDRFKEIDGAEYTDDTARYKALDEWYTGYYLFYCGGTATGDGSDKDKGYQFGKKMCKDNNPGEYAKINEDASKDDKVDSDMDTSATTAVDMARLYSDVAKLTDSGKAKNFIGCEVTKDDDGNLKYDKKAIEKKISFYKHWYELAEKEGIGSAGVSAVIANGIVESGLDPNNIGSAYGIWQWEGKRREGAEKKTKAAGDNNTDKANAQFLYLIQDDLPAELGKSAWDLYCDKLILNYREQYEKAHIEKHKADGHYAFTADVYVDKVKKEYCTDIKEFGKAPAGVASVVFCTAVERARGALYAIKHSKYKNVDDTISSGLTHGQLFNKEYYQRPKLADEIEKVLGGGKVTGTSSDYDKESANAVAKAAVELGYMNESEFVSWKKMTDCTLEWADISSLSASENATLVDWKDDLEKDNLDSWLVRAGRVTVLLLGIIFMIWMVLIYMAYWTDRINNFIDIDILPLITFNKLRMSDTETECTFSVRDLAKGSQRTVNHKAILGIVLVGMAFGALIVSGTIFRVVNALVWKMLRVLGL